jgi:hypothetical protein
MCPSSREKLLYLCDTGICHSVWVASDLLVGLKLRWVASGLLVGLKLRFKPTSKPDATQTE